MLLVVKILLVLICWAVQVAWFWIWWDGATADCQASVALGKRPAWMLRWARPVSAVVALALCFWAGWGSEGWPLLIALWPFLTMVVHGGICLYVAAPLFRFFRGEWYLLTLQWEKWYRLRRETFEILVEWGIWAKYQKVLRKAGEEAALKWLQAAMRESPMARLPVHFDPELPRKLEEAERRSGEPDGGEE